MKSGSESFNLFVTIDHEYDAGKAVSLRLSHVFGTNEIPIPTTAAAHISA